MRCEDYPCCGHGPPPLGDGGGCPDEEGRFDCVLCGVKLARGYHSAICQDCRMNPRRMNPDDPASWDDQYMGPDDEEEER